MADHAPPLSRARSWAEPNVRPWVANALVAVALTILFVGPVLTIPLHIPLTYNEGWNAYFTARAIDPSVAGPLYPRSTTLISNNYPPLSFYIVGALTRLVGDPIVAGRLIALTALLATSGLTGLIVGLLGGSRRWAMIAALTMLLYAATFYSQYTATDDPQWLAQAVMLAGVAVLLKGGAGGLQPSPIAASSIGAASRRRPGFAGPAETRRASTPAVSLVASALLMTAALLIKHNILGAPAAIAVWLLLFDRRAAAIWGVTLVTAIAASLAAFDARFGNDFMADVLHHQRVFHAMSIVREIPTLSLFIPLLGIAVLLFRARGLRAPATAFALFFVVAALVCGIAQRGGEGVNYNAHFETLVALAVAFGLALSVAETGQVIVAVRRVPPTMLVLAVAIPLTIAAPVVVAREALRVSTLRPREAAWLQVERRIAATPGPVACEMLASCFWAGKPFEWDFFNHAERLRLGASVEPLARRIERHDFGAIVLTHGPGFAASDGERLPQPLPALVDHYYAPALDAPDDIAMMEPRPVNSSATADQPKTIQ